MNFNLCTLEDGLVIGGGNCDAKLGSVIAFILSKNKMLMSGSTDIKTAVQQALNDNSAVMLNGMQQRDAANEAAVVGSLAYGYTEELRGAILQDNFVFPKGICSQASHSKLINFKGYAFAITDKGQFVGFRTANANEMEMFPISITAMDTTGAWGDSANPQTDTLTVRYGDSATFFRKLIAATIDFNDENLVQPYELELSGTIASLQVLEKCSRIAVTAESDELTVENATVDGAAATGTVAAGVGGLYAVTLTPAPTSGSTVSLKIKWATDTATNGISNQYSYIMA
jgi:hypothetical protein